MPAKTEKKKRSLSLSTIIMLIISGFTIVITVVSAIFLRADSISKMKNMVESKSIEMAVTAAKLIDGDSLVGIKEEDTDLEHPTEMTPNYEKALHILRDFAMSNEKTSGELAYIYLARDLPDNKFEFIIDPDPKKPAAFGADLEWTGALEAAKNGNPDFDNETYTDEWGTFYSAYAPVFSDKEGHTNEVLFIIGVDVWANWYNNMLENSTRSIVIIVVVASLSGILIGFLISLGIRRRFEVLSKEINALETDVQTLMSEITEPIDSVNVENISQSEKDQIGKLRKQIGKTQKEIKDYIIYTQKQAYVDSLSRLGNRTSYVNRIKQIDLKSPFCVIIYDINGLKYINDNYGHESGDKTITAIGSILKEVYDKESVFRIGGDEFAIVLTDNDKEITMQIFESANKKIEEYDQKGVLTHPISVSKGIAFFEIKKDKTYTDVFSRADENMYKDKEAFYSKYPKLKKKYHR
ncbi:MAG: diguanylate cyclase [Bacilli bacterium]|nr:diguanylate cyclase [Bacilli bacterium]